ASGSLNKAKYKIIISDPENSKDAAALAGGKLESSARSMASLMTDLKEMIPRAMSLEARLWTEIDKIQPLKMKMDGFREDEKYNCADEAEIESREVAASLDSLEADFVAIGGDLVLAESLHLEAKNHYNCALKDLRDAKEAWSKLDISEILDKKRKSPAGDEDIAEILKKKGEVTTEANRIYEKIYFYYPPVGRPQEVMPTCLGNILKSAEMYPKERYNADAVFFWPKLYPLMSTEWTTSLANARGSLDLMVLISLLSFSFSILGGLILLIYRADPQQFLLIFWGSFVLGWVAYRGAITYAVTYGDLIRSTFDLYRDKLITELGLEAPGSMQDEKLFWNELGQWLYRNAPSSNIRYSNAKASKEAK
ncbi:MAG TPA: hypothetical protein VN455_08815, partial [Methanotrichaceae archaeon]|nr:hypothetical protein [Methanotrichaceae archaeon]